MSELRTLIKGFKASGIIASTLVKSITSYYTAKRLVPSWTLEKYVSRDLISKCMHLLIDDGSSLAIERAQKLSKLKMDWLVPVGQTEFRSTQFSTNEKAIDFARILSSTFPKQAEQVAPITAEWVTSKGSKTDSVIYYIHGGSFVFGSPQFERNLTAGLAKAGDAKVFGTFDLLQLHHIDYHRSIRSHVRLLIPFLDTCISSMKDMIPAKSSSPGHPQVET
jgi:hypothetical protein